MICLDTNYLIRALVPNTIEAERIQHWLMINVLLTAPTVVWYEFCCGPVGNREIELVRSLLTAGTLPFLEQHAQESARLFNAVGRQRHLRIDSMIAASAIVANAELATANTADFAGFTKLGLSLVA